MSELYKYCTAEVAALFASGSIRFHNLSQYREIESLGQSIGDPLEATMERHITIDHSGKAGDMHEFTRHFINVPSNTPVNISGLNARYVNRYPDLYAVCLSRNLSKDLAQRFSVDNVRAGLDAYTHAVAFSPRARFRFRLHQATFRRMFATTGWGDLYYGETSRPGTQDGYSCGPQLAALRKNPAYSWQDEYRFVVNPMGRGIRKYPPHFDIELDWPSDVQIRVIEVNNL